MKRHVLMFDPELPGYRTKLEVKSVFPLFLKSYWLVTLKIKCSVRTSCIWW